MLRCKHAGVSCLPSLAVRCDSEKHPLAQRPAILISNATHPGKLGKLAAMGFDAKVFKAIYYHAAFFDVHAHTTQHTHATR